MFWRLTQAQSVIATHKCPREMDVARKDMGDCRKLPSYPWQTCLLTDHRGRRPHQDSPVPWGCFRKPHGGVGGTINPWEPGFKGLS